MLIIIMGVTGAGKTTVGARLAEACGATFYDADDYHSDSAIEKMRSGNPLTDADRASWLERLEQLIINNSRKDETEVLACSALRAAYRSRLTAAADKVESEAVFVYLRVSREVAAVRLRDRPGHFMPASLVKSQFATLEEPDEAIVVDAVATPQGLVAEILAALKARTISKRGNGWNTVGPLQL